MTQPDQPSEGFAALPAVPLGPDEPELFVDAMERIIRYLGDEPGARPTTQSPASGRRARPRPASLPQRAGRHSGG